MKRPVRSSRRHRQPAVLAHRSPEDRPVSALPDRQAADAEPEPAPVDIEHAREGRGGPVETAAPEPAPDECGSAFIEPEDAAEGSEPLLQLPRGS